MTNGRSIRGFNVIDFVEEVGKQQMDIGNQIIDEVATEANKNTLLVIQQTPSCKLHIHPIQQTPKFKLHMQPPSGLRF